MWYYCLISLLIGEYKRIEHQPVNFSQLVSDFCVENKKHKTDISDKTTKD